MTDDPRCKQTLPSGGMCGGVDAHVSECPRNELREEFDRQDGGRMPDEPKQDWPEEPWSEAFVIVARGSDGRGQVADKPTGARAVACVNALAGVPDPAAWVATHRKLARRVRNHRALLERLLGDEDLTDEKLREASEGLLPHIHDQLLEALAALDRAAGGEGGG